MGRFTRSLAQTEKRRRDREDAADREHFPRAEPCHDCAFRSDSPERADPMLWARLLEQTDPANGIWPFRCHFKHDGTEMPIDGEGRYTPELDANGSPIGYPICAGWKRTFDVKLERLRR